VYLLVVYALNKMEISYITYTYTFFEKD